MFCIVAFSSSLTVAREQQNCDVDLIAELKSYFAINEKTWIWSTACKAWPGDKNKLLVAIASDPVGDRDPTVDILPLHIAMLNPKTRKVMSEYHGKYQADTAPGFDHFAIELDTGHYELAKGVRAFGIRVTGFHKPTAAEGGSDSELSLYVSEGKTIRPILENFPTEYWAYENGFPWSSSKFTIIKAKLTIRIARTTSKGFADLFITAKSKSRKHHLTHLLDYDGKSYFLKGWDEKWDKWWNRPKN